MEPCYNKVLGTMTTTLLYQVSHIGKKQTKKYKELGLPNYLVIRGFCYIQPLYNKVPLYYIKTQHRKMCACVCTCVCVCVCSYTDILVCHFVCKTMACVCLHFVPLSSSLLEKWNLVITRSWGPSKLPCYIRFVISVKNKEI